MSEAKFTENALKVSIGSPEELQVLHANSMLYGSGTNFIWQASKFTYLYSDLAETEKAWLSNCNTSTIAFIAINMIVLAFSLYQGKKILTLTKCENKRIVALILFINLTLIQNLLVLIL